MRIGFAILGLASAVAAADETVTVRHARNWQPNASEGRCDIRVRVDGEADFGLRGETLIIRTLNGEPATDAGSECSTPLPRNVENLRFRGIDGRGDVRLLEEPSARNRWMAVVRVRDTKGGSEEYHFRLEWGRGSSFSGGGGGAATGSGRPGGASGLGSNWNSSGDLTRVPTRELRREIERRYQDVTGRRPSTDIVDDYIDRVRMERWSLDQVRGDIERKR
jgi:hypothetical protein